MTEQEIHNLIDKMQEVFPTRLEINSRFDAIEKDLKSVVRIYNLDEEMNAVYARLKLLEQVAGINL